MREDGPFPASEWQKLREGVVKLRRTLHAYPEISGREEHTAARIRQALVGAGVELVAESFAGHGLLFRVRGDASGPVMLFRADLDGLPLQEASGVAHASRAEFQHHACGHDGHMAMLVGAMQLLALRRDRVRGTIYALFQPAEETGFGMEACLADLHRLASFEVDQAFAIHNVPGHPKGELVVPRGPAAVASTGIRIRLHGTRAHAGEPHLARNPIHLLGELVPVLLQAPTCLPFGRAGLVTIVRIHAGEDAFGSSPDIGELNAVLRADTQEDLGAMVTRVRSEVAARARSAGLEQDLELVDAFPATTNDPAACATIDAVAAAMGLRVVVPARPFPWSEDFGHATKKWPSALIGLGAGASHAPLHSEAYDFPDDIIDAGVMLWYGLASRA